MQWVSHSQTSSSKQRMCATQKPQLATDPNYAKPWCKMSRNRSMQFVGRPRTFSRSKRTHQRFTPQGQRCEWCRSSHLSQAALVVLLQQPSVLAFLIFSPTCCTGKKVAVGLSIAWSTWMRGPWTQVTYLKARRQELGGYLPLRSPAKAWVHACHRVIGPVGTLVVSARSLLSWSCHRMRRPIPCSTKVPISEKDTSHLVHHVVFRDEK